MQNFSPDSRSARCLSDGVASTASKANGRRAASYFRSRRHGNARADPRRYSQNHQHGDASELGHVERRRWQIRFSGSPRWLLSFDFGRPRISIELARDHVPGGGSSSSISDGYSTSSDTRPNVFLGSGHTGHRKICHHGKPNVTWRNQSRGSWASADLHWPKRLLRCGNSGRCE